MMKLGFIGFGNMAGAILGGILEKNVITSENVWIYDPSEKAQNKAKELGLNVCPGIVDVTKNSQIIILATKPNMIKEVLNVAGSTLDDKAVISIAAGISTTFLRSNCKGRILRIMPNTPALVGKGAIGLCTDTDLTKEELAFAYKMFEAVGIVAKVEEKLMDAVTGLSGSGPAFVALFIEALADGGVKSGLSRDNAINLAAQTVLGTASMVLEKNIHPAILKDMVCSPAGTTIEGVSVLEDCGFRGAVIESVVAATEKSKNMH